MGNLVITRRAGESVDIDDSIRVTVLHVEGGKVRMGIVAPPHIHILRSELTRQPRVSQPVPCPDCHGSGSSGYVWTPRDGYKACPRCKGRGAIQSNEGNADVTE